MPTADLITFVADRPGHDFRYGVRSDRLVALGLASRVVVRRGAGAHRRLVPGHLDGLEAAHVVPVVTALASRGGRRMRLVVTGAGGDLGRAFLARMPGHHEVHAFDRDALDVGDHDAVRQVVEPLAPTRS